ncbi:MAG TPA: hypothetical protein VIK91_24995 [Nannocystis sp.]
MLQNLTNNERDKVLQFQDHPGYGGQTVKVKVGLTTETLPHVTYGAGSHHVSIFYRRDGQDYRIVGVGQHDGKKGGKTIYSCLWEGKGGHRVQVQILDTK